MAVSYVGKGAQSTGAGGNRGPSLPAGMAEDDLMVGPASARTNAGLYTHPTAGWTAEGPFRPSNKNTLQIFWKVHDGSESVSALKYTQGEDGANESQAAQYAAFRGVDPANPLTLGTPYTETGVQNVTFANAVTVPNGGAVLYIGHKTTAWTSVATLTDGTGLTWVEIAEPFSTTGNDAGMVWGYALNDTGASVVLDGAAVAAVTGGSVGNTLAMFVVLNPVGVALVSGSGASVLALPTAGAGVVGVTGEGASVLDLPTAGTGFHTVTAIGSAVLAILGSGSGSFILGVSGAGAAVLAITGAGTGSTPIQEDEAPLPTIVTAEALSSTSVGLDGLDLALTGAGNFDFYVTFADEPLVLSDGDYLATEQ